MELCNGWPPLAEHNVLKVRPQLTPTLYSVSWRCHGSSALQRTAAWAVCAFRPLRTLRCWTPACRPLPTSVFLSRERWPGRERPAGSPAAVAQTISTSAPMAGLEPVSVWFAGCLASPGKAQWDVMNPWVPGWGGVGVQGSHLGLRLGPGSDFWFPLHWAQN